MKLCIDCRFAELVTSPREVWMCSHPTSVFRRPRSPVTGTTPDPVPLECRQARWFDDDGRCGLSGRFWELRS